jgi:hypothetical protein
MKSPPDAPHRQPACDGHTGHPAKTDVFVETVKPMLVRLPESVLAALREEAAKDESSVNSTIVSILKYHSSWGRYQKRLGFMPLHKNMILAMLNKMTLEEIEAIGRMQKDQTVRDFLVFNSTYSLETFIEWIGLRCNILGFQLMIRRGTAPDALNIVIHHDMGQKWSYYYKGMFSAALEDLLPSGTDVTFNTGNASFAIEIAGVKKQDGQTILQ